MAQRLTTEWPERPGEQRAARLGVKELKRAWPEFFGRLPWEYAATLTFDPQRRGIDRAEAEREAQRWCGWLGELTRRPVGWMFTLEKTKAGAWHAHVLVIGADGLDPAVAAGVWKSRNGIAHIQPVKAAAGAVSYATKNAYRTGTAVISDTILRYKDRLLDDGQVEAISPSASAPEAVPTLPRCSTPNDADAEETPNHYSAFEPSPEVSGFLVRAIVPALLGRFLREGDKVPSPSSVTPNSRRVN